MDSKTESRLLYRKRSAGPARGWWMRGVSVLFITIQWVAVLHFSPFHAVLAQIVSTENYEIGVAPDLWYNSVDGIQLGIRFRGEEPGTFLAGPHRLNGGIRLGTRLPGIPLSGLVQYEHPVPLLTGSGHEGAVQLSTMLRAGVHRHEAGVRKRWQKGPDEKESVDGRAFLGFYRRFDDRYLLYESLWMNDPVFFFQTHLRVRESNVMGRWTMHLNGLGGLAAGEAGSFIDYSGNKIPVPQIFGVEGFFTQASVEWIQVVGPFSWFSLKTRLFGGFSSDATPVQHRYMVSNASAYQWLDSAWFRARGTLPDSWIQNGVMQRSGGPGLRGYTPRTFQKISNDEPAWVQHAWSFNTDFYYPNPLDRRFSAIPYLKDLLAFKSYLFADAGWFHETGNWKKRPKGNAGAGFMLSLNIPDYLGNDRGFFLRYEIPFWLSNPDVSEDPFRIRQHLGMGAHFYL